MPQPLLLALDQGTTSSRSILFDSGGNPLAAAQREVRQIFPQPGWVEHDPADIWETQLGSAREMVAFAEGLPGKSAIGAIGITNQRETTVLWERRTGRPLYHAIVWQDRRTADFCAGLKRDAAVAAMIQRKTGLLPDAYFSASKLRWLLDHIPGARERAVRGELAFGTVDAWLLWNLTGGEGGPGSERVPVHATDPSNASRTMLFNIQTCEWDEELLALFDIPREVLPEVRPSAGYFGETSLLGGAGPISITGIAGDQQAALFGQACTSSGLAKNTYGTGCFLLANLGPAPAPPPSRHHLLTTIAWQAPAAGAGIGISSGAHTGEAGDAAQIVTTFAREGSVFVGGAVVQWLRDGLGLIRSAEEIELLARSVPDSGGLVIVPAFAGLGAPHWDQYARGTIAGITRGTTAGHFARAALESIAFQVADLLDVMNADVGGGGAAISELRVDGGAARNDLLLQFQADLLRIPVLRPKVTETTALGAALLAAWGAGLAAGSAAEQSARWKLDRAFVPEMSLDEVRGRRSLWTKALNRALDWESH